MRDRRRLSHQDVDRLLAGKAPSGADRLDEDLAAFTRDVRAAFVRPPSLDVERRHLAAAVEASRLTTDKGEPAVRPASKAQGPESQASGLPKWRRRSVLSSLFASLAAKIAGVAVAAVAATGGLAAAGALPAPAQQAIASAASSVGFSLPSPGDGSPATQGQATGHRRGAAPTSTVSDGVTGHRRGTASTSTASDGVTETVEASGVNHGNCVSYATSIAASLGFSRPEKGQFVSAIAQDHTAMSAPVTGTATPAAACQAAIDKAKAATTASSHGKPDSVKGSANDNPTPSASNSAGSVEPDSHATSTPTGYGNPTTPGGNPGYGPGSHPTGNPGYGQPVTPTAHPTGKP